MSDIDDDGIDQVDHPGDVVDVAFEPFEPPDVTVLTPPAGGLWRVGRAVAPMRASKATPDVEASPRQGNRFDTADFGTIYMGTTLQACYGETLARYRPTPDLARMVEDDWKCFMAPGQIPAEWRDKRAKVHATLAAGEVFVDIEALATREYLRKALALGLSALEVEDLDVAAVRGPDRRLTRLIARWAYQQVDDQDVPLYAGVRYLSRLNTDWECWALFDDTRIASQRIESIPVDDPELLKVCTRYGIHVH
jgi:hypothetical protein